MDCQALACADWGSDGRVASWTSLGRNLVDRKYPVLEKVIQPLGRCQRQAEDHPPQGNTNGKGLEGSLLPVQRRTTRRRIAEEL
jgi:hypothetical protein